jgi:hypothetical protein
MILLLPHHSSLSPVKSRPATHMKTEKEKLLAAEIRRGGDEGGAKSHDGENAWSSIIQ